MPKSSAPYSASTLTTTSSGVLGFAGFGCDVRAIIRNFHEEQRDHQYAEFGETYMKVIYKNDNILNCIYLINMICSIEELLQSG